MGSVHGRLEFGEPRALAAPPPCPAARATDRGHSHLPADTLPTQPHSGGTADASQPPRRPGRKGPCPHVCLDPDGQGGGRSAARGASTVSAAVASQQCSQGRSSRLLPGSGPQGCVWHVLWLPAEPGPTSAQAWEGGREAQSQSGRQGRREARAPGRATRPTGLCRTRPEARPQSTRDRT